LAERDADLLLRTIVEACPTTFLVSRVEDGKIIYFPPASRERFGHITSTLEFFLDPNDRKPYLEALLPCGILNDYPVQFRRGDGSVMQGLTSARVTDYKGEDVIVSATRDITDQLAMQAELERQRNISHQNEKLSALGELLAGVAHELNNPLSIVVGYALMLRNKIEDPTQRKRVERIGEAAERCAKIVKMFLAMARQRPARIENCSLNEILETSLDVAGFGFEAKNIRIKLELAPNLPPVAADPDQMAQVFINLIANAEHTLVERGKGARLKLISLYDKSSNEVVIKIRDNGAGVHQAIQRRIFEPFFTTKDTGSGTGIGLAFSHRIITSHEGTLSLYSIPGNGATFIVRMKAVEASLQPAPVVQEKASTGNNKRILVVDDEIGVSDLICDILKESGYEVEACNDAQQALQLLKSQVFDAILSDMKMPGLDGEAFFKEVELLYSDYIKRFAFVTGDVMSPHVADYLESTSALYLEKPVAPAELIALVEELCAQDRNDST
jgi:signal transduction histidine kinase/CheY-like chemotaxis protein